MEVARPKIPFAKRPERWGIICWGIICRALLSIEQRKHYLRFRSIHAFVVCFSSTGEEYLYEVKDISHDQHTGIFLETIIEDVVNSIETFNGTRDMKVNAVVSDNAANLKLARELFTGKPENKHIFNVRCFIQAHSSVDLV